MWCLFISNLLEGCYGEVNIHILAQMKILGEADVIASGGVAVTNVEMAYTSTPTFYTPYLPLSSDFLDLCVQHFSLPLSLPLFVSLSQPPYFSLYMPLYASVSVYECAFISPSTSKNIVVYTVYVLNVL